MLVSLFVILKCTVSHFLCIFVMAARNMILIEYVHIFKLIDFFWLDFC